jgi:hypothetical protein
VQVKFFYDPSHVFICLRGVLLLAVGKNMSTVFVEHGLINHHVFAVSGTLNAVVLSVVNDFPLVALISVFFVRVPRED